MSTIIEYGSQQIRFTESPRVGWWRQDRHSTLARSRHAFRNAPATGRADDLDSLRRRLAVVGEGVK